jgi:hypothetical protein
MSNKLIDRSADLKRLRDTGYSVHVRAGYLLVNDVPYVDSRKNVRRGTLVSQLDLAGDVTARPQSHVAYFIGDHPCQADGTEIAQIKSGSGKQTLADGVEIDHTFSAKPRPSGQYDDYHATVTTYVAILSGPAQSIDPTITAQTFAPCPVENEGDSPFHYLDTSSSRAEIVVITKKLALAKIAIIGLGGTGSYVLDLVAKTPVREIHLFDGDDFLQHNAFRSPGAPSIDDLTAKPKKSGYFTNLYSKMHRGIIDRGTYITAENVDQLRDMSFVFLCLESGSMKKVIIANLEEFGIPFIDVGLGVEPTDNMLGGILRITTSTPAQRDHVRRRVSFSERDGDDDYNRNIQIADLNALNAAFAVNKWKKLFGFYRDLKCEHHSTYTIDGNLLINDDIAHETESPTEA